MPVPGVRNKQDKASARGFEDELRWVLCGVDVCPLQVGTCLCSAVHFHCSTAPLAFILPVFPAPLSSLRNMHRSPHHTPACPLLPPACSRIIVDCEVNTGAWTLMHRFNKATDLLEDVMSVGACAALYCAVLHMYLHCSTLDSPFTALH